MPIGYLKVSISIIGPGEKMKVHNEDEEIAKEIANETKAGMDVGSLVLSVPTIRKEWKFLVMSLYRAETLTVMDSKVGIGGVSLSSAGTDAYVKLQVGGAKPLKTKAVTVKGDNRLAINPIFNYELWFPVSIPSTTQIIKITVLDKDELGDEAIGLFYEKLGDILRTPNSSLDAKWYNIYGKPEFKNDSFARKAVELAKKSEQAAKSRLTFDNATDYNELYNNVPDKGSTFKGRVLCKFRVATKRPTKFDTVEVKPFIQKISKNVRSPIPPSQAYVLKALVVVGNMLPNFRDLSATKVLTSGITFQDLRVKVTIGAVELTTRPAKDEDGMCRWNELLRSDPIQFPQDYRQIPDIIIYLVNKANKPVCFRRIKPVAVNKDGDVEFLGFGRDAEWVILQEDKVINAIDDDEFPGSLLIKLGFGPKEEAEQSSQEWTDAIKNAKNMGNFQVF